MRFPRRITPDSGVLVTGASPPGLIVAGAWPLARRAGFGTLRAGGVEMTRRMLEGARLGMGDRVIDLAPGAGATGRLAQAADLHAWTGVCSSAAEARRLQRSLKGHDHRAIVAPADATGLPAGDASVVTCEGLLTGLSDPRKRAVVAEAHRLLRAGGRLTFHEIYLREPDDDLRAQLGRSANGGVRPLTLLGWRDLVTEAGLTVVGTMTAPLVVPSLHGLVAEEGPRRTAEIMGRLVRPGLTSRRWRHTLDLMQRNAERLGAVVIVAERPVVQGLLRRRGTSQR